MNLLENFIIFVWALLVIDGSTSGSTSACKLQRRDVDYSNKGYSVYCKCDGYKIKKCHAEHNERREDQIRIEFLEATEFSDDFEIISDELSFRLYLANLYVQDLSRLFQALRQNNYEIYQLHLSNLPNVTQESFKTIAKETSMEWCQDVSLKGRFGNAVELANIVGSGVNYVTLVDIESPGVLFNDPFQPDFIDFSYLSVYNVVSNKLNYVLPPSLDNGAEVYWSNDTVYPDFFQPKKGGEHFELHIKNGPEFFTKDSLMYVQKISFLELPLLVNRIEYGSLVSNDSLKWEIDETNRGLFLMGHCTNLSIVRLCELCLMHQFRLHRLVSDTARMCVRNLNPDPSEMKKCFWDKPKALPASLYGRNIDTSNFDLDIPVCTDLPQDIREFLNPNLRTDVSLNTTDTPGFNCTQSPEETAPNGPVYPGYANTNTALCVFQLLFLLAFSLAAF